jgi:adenylate kinase family enzyme
VSSAYTEAVIGGVKSLAKNAALPHEVVNAVFEEFCREQKTGLIVIDNYPTYRDSLVVFKHVAQQLNASVTVFCLVDP